MEHLKRGQTWQITGSITHKKADRITNKIRTKPKLSRQATRTKINFTKQEPCQVSKVGQKYTKPNKNKYK
jgi:hypothetical protein